VKDAEAAAKECHALANGEYPKGAREKPPSSRPAGHSRLIHAGRARGQHRTRMGRGHLSNAEAICRRRRSQRLRCLAQPDELPSDAEPWVVELDQFCPPPAQPPESAGANSGRAIEARQALALLR
jgi:hypothetical protein